MFNRAILIGRLTADPELKQTQSGDLCMQLQHRCGPPFFRPGQRAQD